MNATQPRLPILPLESFGFCHMSAGFKERFGDFAAGTARELIGRFTLNDWGLMSEEDREYNDRDLASGQACRLMGSYDVEGVTVWVIGYIQHDPELQSNPDMCNTCVLMPADY